MSYSDEPSLPRAEDARAERMPPGLPGADIQLRRLFAYWDARREDRPMPSRGDLDLLDIAAITPHALLAAVLDGGADFIVRLFGAELVELYGRDLTGQRISLIPEETFGRHILDAYREVVRSGRPLHQRVALESEALRRRFGSSFGASVRAAYDQAMVYAYERLALPLGDDQGVTMILAVVKPLRRPPPGADVTL